MTTVVLKPDPQLFPAGTTVGAFPRSRWGIALEGAPSGSAAQSVAIAAGGTLTYTTLTDGVEYVATAVVASTRRFLRFTPGPVTLRDPTFVGGYADGEVPVWSDADQRFEPGAGGAGGGGAPTGAAGGVLGGTYPNPSFAADMTTQAELDAATALLVPKSSMAYAAVQRSTAQTAIVTATNTAVIFDTEVADTEAMVDIAANPTRVTIVTAGIYLVTATCAWVASTVGLRANFIQKNGTTMVAQTAAAASAAGGTMAVTISKLIPLAAADYIELLIRQTAGGNLDTAIPAPYGISMEALRMRA